MADLNDNLGELNTTTAGLALAMKGVTAAINGLKKGFEFFDKTQKEAIKFGLDVKQVQNRLGDSINTLNGSIDRKLNTSIATLNAGIDGNIGSVNSLINEQQILGQNYKRTATVFGKLEATAGFNNSQLGSLATTVDKNRVQYNRSTEFLIDALDQLSDQFTSLSLQEGLADPIIGAYSDLAGQLGPSLGNSLSTAFKTLIAPEFETISKRALLGIPEFGDFLFNLRSSEQGIIGFKQAFATAKDTIMQFTGGVYSREVIRSIFGPGGEAIVNVARALENVTDDQIAEHEKRSKTNQLFSVALEQIFDPLKELVINAAPGLGGVAEALSNTIKNITGDEGLNNFLIGSGIKIAEYTELFGNGLIRLLEIIDSMIPGEGLGIIYAQNKEREKVLSTLPDDLRNRIKNIFDPWMASYNDPRSQRQRELEEIPKLFEEELFENSDDIIEALLGNGIRFDLSDIKKSLEESRKSGQDLEKENQRILDELLGKGKETADNTGVLVDAMTGTTSQFFQETGDIFARSAAAILGFSPGARNYQEELVELTRMIAEKTGEQSLISMAEGN